MGSHSESELSQAGMLFDVQLNWLVSDMVLVARYIDVYCILILIPNILSDIQSQRRFHSR